MATSTGLLAGRLAIVTGGASGIGRSICQVFAREGAKVAVVDVNKNGIQETQAMMDNASDHITVVTDVSDSQAVKDMFSQVNSRFSATACVVVNGAGIIRDKSLMKMTEQDFDKVINVNLKGTYLVMQQAAKEMRAADLNGTGSVINISSIVGKTGNLGQTNYAASKAGVLGLTKTAAKELGRHGIRVNAICPGFITTPMTDALPEHILQGIQMMIPLLRFGKPEEVAEVCAFLASTRSSYITGQAIEVTGGLNF